ncbi:MAG TPA: glycosyltransferase, partial [Nevskiaceae bacterium]|nr:glycosyltransferase [Nevskiaceae bacterium]
MPDAPGAEPSGPLDGVDVIRYRYAPRCLETLVNNGGIAANLRRARWKWTLVPGFFLGQWWAARRVLQSRSVSVIHAHWLLPQGIVARALHRRFGVPYVVTSHG